MMIVNILPIRRPHNLLKPGGHRGRYHNHHLLLMRRVPEGHRPPRRSPSPAHDRRSDDRPLGRRHLLRGQHRQDSPLPPRIRLHAHHDQQEPPQPPPALRRAFAVVGSLFAAGRALQETIQQPRANIRGGLPAHSGVRQHPYPPLPALSPTKARRSVSWLRPQQTALLLRFAGAFGDDRGGRAGGVLLGGRLGSGRERVEGFGAGLARRLDPLGRQGLHRLRLRGSTGGSRLTLEGPAQEELQAADAFVGRVLGQAGSPVHRDGLRRVDQPVSQEDPCGDATRLRAEDRLVLAGLLHPVPVGDNLGYEYTDVTMIVRFITEYYMVAVTADSEYQNLEDLLNAVKENPGEVPIGAAGDDRLPFALLVDAAGGNPEEINFVAYEGGGEQTAALLNGDIAAAMAGVSEFRGQLEAGDLRGLAVLRDERLEPPLDDMPTAPEEGYDVTLDNWRGLYGPPDMPEEAVTYWENTIQKMVSPLRHEF